MTGGGGIEQKPDKGEYSDWRGVKKDHYPNQGGGIEQKPDKYEEELDAALHPERRKNKYGQYNEALSKKQEHTVRLRFAIKKLLEHQEVVDADDVQKAVPKGTKPGEISKDITPIKGYDEALAKYKKTHANDKPPTKGGEPTDSTGDTPTKGPKDPEDPEEPETPEDPEDPEEPETPEEPEEPEEPDERDDPIYDPPAPVPTKKPLPTPPKEPDNSKAVVPHTGETDNSKAVATTTATSTTNSTTTAPPAEVSLTDSAVTPNSVEQENKPKPKPYASSYVSTDQTGLLGIKRKGVSSRFSKPFSYPSSFKSTAYGDRQSHRGQRKSRRL